MNFLERGRFSQKLIIRFSLNSPNSKMGTRLIYCESLDEFLVPILLSEEFKGGGGVHPYYFVKLDFEIAVDQQTRARDRAFEGVPDSG